MKSLHLSLPAPLTQGLPGLLGSAAFAFVMLAVAAGFNRLHIKLQL